MELSHGGFKWWASVFEHGDELVHSAVKA